MIILEIQVKTLKKQDQGCNLYPNSGCASIGGLLHYKCLKTSECFSSKEDAEKCERGEQVSDGGCEEGEFKCLEGRCIPMHQVLQPHQLNFCGDIDVTAGV